MRSKKVCLETQPHLLSEVRAGLSRSVLIAKLKVSFQSFPESFADVNGRCTGEIKEINSGGSWELSEMKRLCA